jgi:predicted nucleic acid-binding protein
VATHPKKDRGLEMSAAQTELILTKFESAFSLKHDNQMVYKEWRQLVTQQTVLGKPSHDARIAAALIAHDITHFVTFNKGHFERFTAVKCLLPSEV